MFYYADDHQPVWYEHKDGIFVSYAKMAGKETLTCFLYSHKTKLLTIGDDDPLLFICETLKDAEDIRFAMDLTAQTRLVIRK